LVQETVELRELRVFLTLADELHFGRTAARLGLTQSRVSQTLRDLEHKLGTQLVHRTSRRVTLTAPGERFQAALAPAFAQLTEVVDRAATARLTGTVRLALIYPNVGGEQLVKVIDAFEAACPSCEVEVTPTPRDDPGGPLRRGEIDLLATPVLRDPPCTVVAVVLGSEPRVLAVASNHPLGTRAHVSVEDLADYKVAASTVLRDDHQEAWVPFHTPTGRPIERLARRPETYDELAMLVARGKVVYPTFPSTAAHFGPPNIVLAPLTDLPPVRVVLLAMPGVKPLIREFLRFAENLVGNAVA
jgi:DNA-binding transcriptional LysR family regulator